MQPAKPSLTAYGVAVRRATHQLCDAPPLVFADPFAVPILGPHGPAQLEKAAPDRNTLPNLALRARLVARSRLAEDKLAEAVANGTRQYVLLGAGLDTFAWRNPHPGLRVFEVDHPATQQWKRELATHADLGRPASLTWAPVDFETHNTQEDPLANGLEQAGFDPRQPAFFAWLGVVPYLTLEAFRATVAWIAARPAGSGVTFDYGQPRHTLPPDEQLIFDELAARVAKAGEPFQLFFTPADIARELAAFSRHEDLGGADLNRLYFQNRPDELRCYLTAGRIVTAWL